MYTIKAYRIVGTKIRVFSAFEPYNGHSTFTHDDSGNRLGRVGTRPLPASLAILPIMSEERSQEVRRWRDQQYQEAYRAIIDEYPEARCGIPVMGEIELFDG